MTEGWYIVPANKRETHQSFLLSISAFYRHTAHFVSLLYEQMPFHFNTRFIYILTKGNLSDVIRFLKNKEIRFYIEHILDRVFPYRSDSGMN